MTVMEATMMTAVTVTVEGMITMTLVMTVIVMMICGLLIKTDL